MKSLEPKALVVVGAQPLEIQQPLVLHLLRLKREGVIAFPAPNRSTRTPLRALVKHPRPVSLHPAPSISGEGEHLHKTGDIVLITPVLVSNRVPDSILAHPAIRAHHMRDHKIHRTIQPPRNALIESDQIRLSPVCTNGADVPLLNEGLDTSFLQNLRNVLEYSIVCSQACPPREPRVAKRLVDRKPVRNNVDRHARLKTKKGHAGMIRELELRLKKEAE